MPSWERKDIRQRPEVKASSDVNDEMMNDTNPGSAIAAGLATGAAFGQCGVLNAVVWECVLNRSLQLVIHQNVVAQPL